MIVMNLFTLLISVLVLNLPATHGILGLSSDGLKIGQNSNNVKSTSKTCSSVEFCNSRRNASILSDESACLHEIRQLSVEQFGAILDSTLKNFADAVSLQMSGLDHCDANDILKTFPYWDYRLDFSTISPRNSRLFVFLRDALNFVNLTRLMDADSTDVLTNFTDTSLFNLNAAVEEPFLEWNSHQLAMEFIQSANDENAIDSHFLNVKHILKLLLTVTARTNMEDHDTVFDRVQCERSIEWLQWKESSQKCEAKFVNDWIDSSTIASVSDSVNYSSNMKNLTNSEDMTTNERENTGEDNSKTIILTSKSVVNSLQKEIDLDFVQNNSYNSNVFNEFDEQNHAIEEITNTRENVKEYDKTLNDFLLSPYLLVLPVINSSISTSGHVSNNAGNISKSEELINNVSDMITTSITPTTTPAETVTIESIKNGAVNLFLPNEEHHKADRDNNERRAHRRRKNHKNKYKHKKTKKYLKSTIPPAIVTTMISTVLPTTVTDSKRWNNASETVARSYHKMRHFGEDKFHKKSGYYKFDRKLLAKHRTPEHYSSAEILATGGDLKLMSDKDANGRYIFDTKYNFPEEKLPLKHVYSNDNFANVEGDANNYNNLSNDNEGLSSDFTPVPPLITHKVDNNNDDVNINLENHLDRLLKYLSKPKLPKGTIRWKSRTIPIPTAYFTITIIEGPLSRQNRPPSSTSKKRVFGVQIYVMGLNMPTGYTQITEGHQLKGSSAALVRTLSPLSSGPFVEFKVRVVNKYGNSCRQLCLDSSQRYRRCSRKALRISSYRRFSDPIPFYQSIADALDNQWTGRGYYRRRKYDYLLFRCD